MPQHSRPLIVFDLDETLLHCQEKDFREAEYTTEYGYVAIRNGVDEMLDGLAGQYDFMIWSNNGRPYIDAMLKLVWPERHALVDVFTSSESTIVGRDGMGIPFYKETRKVAKRHPEYDLNRILGIDDKPAVYSRNYGNLVCVSEFVGPFDQELVQLRTFLESIAGNDNLRKLEKRYWKSGIKPDRHNETPSLIEPF